MANLTFTPDATGLFSSGEVQVTSDFNLHLERKADGPCHIKVKTADNEFASAGTIMGGKVIDIDIYAQVFPKTIIIVSTSEVLFGECTFADGSTIKPIPPEEVVHDRHYIFADGLHYRTADGKYYTVKK